MGSWNEWDAKVKYGSVTMSSKTTAISATIERKEGTVVLAKADHFFDATPVDLDLLADPLADKDIDGQQTFEGTDTAIKLTGRGIVKGFKVNGSGIGIRIAFEADEVDAEELTRFISQRGRLVTRRVDDAEAND